VSDRLHIELSAAHEERFDRFRLIQWWDQAKLRSAHVLVIGAGALGNEIVKNLALLGIGNLLIADLDRVENSNLSRSILYRERDNGLPKAHVAARAAQDIYPQMNVCAFHGDVIHDLGLGVFRWADVVLAGLDNREARLAINRNCWRLGKPWIDGAIEQIQGVARVFVPEGPCYECTMSERDWKLLNYRRSCNLLTREQMLTERTATTPTISSIIAAVQCQEAVKLLHGLLVMRGRGWVFDGLNTEGYQVEYQQKEECYSHDPLDEVVTLDACSTTCTAGEVLAEARRRLGSEAELEFARDVLAKLICPACGAEEELFTSLGKVSGRAARCPTCGANREVSTFYKLRGDEPFLERPLAEIGIPPWDILIARTPERALGLEIAGDAEAFLNMASTAWKDI
jgi:molybdopterin/thiamine biosynthesis adenylyltransferase